MLVALARASTPISHRVLDELPPGHAERYVRHVLVATGVLPARNDDLERIPVWLDQLLTDRPAHHAQLLRPFTTWDQLRRARRRTAGRLHSPGAATTIRKRVRLALRFLDWLDNRGLELATLAAHDVEAWLAGGKSHYEIRYFLTWAARRGLTTSHPIAHPPAASSAPILDEEERWRQLRCCLNDDTLPLETRAAGALVLLFGIPAERIRHLTVDDIQHDRDSTYLRLGVAPLPVPPRIAELLHTLAETPHTRSALTRGTPPTWRFPGVTPGQPLTRKAFNDNLLQHGIDTRAGRTAALIALAGQLPVPVLADVLDISIDTAQKWASHTQRDWATYLAARTHDAHGDTP